MSIAFTILGLLSAGSWSGYDLKKVFAESESLPWSGNNNQIYKTLVELHREGLASQEVQQPAEGPARKVYSITKEGTAALREWLMSAPESPQLRAPILARLIAADVLSAEELDTLLARYADELRLRILGLEELQRRSAGSVAGSDRRALLQRLTDERPLRLLRDEEAWLHEIRWAVTKLEKEPRL